MGRVLRTGLVPMLVRVDARDYRVGDAEREQVVGLLQQAVGQGMLTLDEFTDRMDAALAARTRGELGEVVADLPVHSAPAQVEVLPLNVTMSSIRRSSSRLSPV